MDVAVAEDPAGRADVLGGRRRRVRGDEVDAVQLAEPPVEDGPPRRRVAGVEPALEADVHRHARLGGAVADLQRRAQVRRDGLLAERGDAGVAGAGEEFGVRGGRGGDDDRVQARAEHGVRAVGAGAERAGQRLGAPPVGVPDQQVAHQGVPAQEPGVPRPDPSRTQQSDPHCVPPMALSDRDGEFTRRSSGGPVADTGRSLPRHRRGLEDLQPHPERQSILCYYIWTF